MDQETIVKRIANNIKEFRLKQDLNQEELAKTLGVSRTTVTSWEKDTPPQTLQLIRFYEEFGISIDELLGINGKVKKTIILDTCVLIKKPKLLDQISKQKFNKICLTETVLNELNNIKDRKKGNISQQAWLAMKSFTEHKEKDSRFCLLKDVSNTEKNDDRIMDVAIEEANNDPNQIIYILSDDIYFGLKTNIKVNKNEKCVHRQNKNIVNLTLKAYEDKFENDESNYNREDSRAFYEAVDKGNIEEMKKLKKNRRPDINYIDPSLGYTALICSLRNNNKEAFNLLLEMGADVNKRDEHKYCFPPITHCIQITNPKFNAEEYINQLVNHGADVNLASLGENKGNTALMVACWHGKLKLVKMLVEKGAKTNLQDLNGYTALIKAIIKLPKKDPQNSYYEQIIKYLFNKTDIELRDYSDKTAKDYIAEKKDMLDNPIGYKIQSDFIRAEKQPWREDDR